MYRGAKLGLEIFGASHAPEIGMTCTGLPAGERVDLEELDRFLQRRAPGRGSLSTARKEGDHPIFRCGLTGNSLDGGPLTAVLLNTNVRTADYQALRDVPRPGHADYTAYVKYGGRLDMSGGGPFSGRMTAPLCIAGGICKQLLSRRGIEIDAHIRSVGAVEDRPFDPMGEENEDMSRLRQRSLPVLDEQAGERMSAAILRAKGEGDSLGGVVECLVTGLPAGLGGPLFEGLEGRLAQMLFAIPAVKGVEFGAGFGAARMRGSAHNDPFVMRNGQVATETNHCGGILGGITDGMPLVFRAAFKPTPSIGVEQRSVSLSGKCNRKLNIVGRHDPCIVPRAVPVVEAAAAIVLLDELL